MKIIIAFLSFCMLLSANDANSSFSSKFVPIISSNPNSGTSLGIMNAMLYNTDANSSKSQALIMVQYSDTKSWSIFGMNSSYFDSNNYKLLVLGAYMHNNSELVLSIDSPLVPPSIANDYDGNADFEVDVAFVLTQLQYQIYPHFYAGGQVFYANIAYTPTNQAGQVFMLINGMQDAANAALGLALTYDTRSLNEKLYPRNATLVELMANTYPTALGNDESYTSAQINARLYSNGFKKSDVWANQFFGQYSSDNAPDSGLAALGSRSVLRGFAIGQYKAKYMSAYQSEYRYQLDNTPFRFVAFAGIASLEGGSKGVNVGNQNFSREDNGIYYSGGVGARYAIQPKAGVDYRIDFAYTSTQDYGLYATVNQAF